MRYQPIPDRSCRGLARMVAILILLTALLAVLVLGIPLWHYFMDRSDAYSCAAALATANDQIKTYILTTNSDPSADDCKAEVTRAMDGWDDLCPAGGDCYIVKETETPEVPYKVVCALHDKDTEQACRLNAESALKQLRAQQKLRASQTDQTVTLNSESFTVTYDDTETVIVPTISGLKKAGGALIAYHAEDGIVDWLCYADGNYVCVWSADDDDAINHPDGWTID